MDGFYYLLLVLLGTQIHLTYADDPDAEPAETGGESEDAVNKKMFEGSDCSEIKGDPYGPTSMMVSLRKKKTSPEDVTTYKHICSGVLVTEYYALSVKSCLKSEEDRPHFAVEMWRLELLMKSSKDLQTEYTGATTTITEWLVSEHEIMVLKLQTPINEDPKVKRAILPKPDYSGIFSIFCPTKTAIGWGNPDIQFIQCIPIEVIPNEDCKMGYKDFIENGSISYNADNMFCTTQKVSFVSEGSAIICNDYTVYALTAFSRQGMPQINYRLDRSLDFIYSVTGLEKFRKSCALRLFISKFILIISVFFFKHIN